MLVALMYVCLYQVTSPSAGSQRPLCSSSQDVLHTGRQVKSSPEEGDDEGGKARCGHHAHRRHRRAHLALWVAAQLSRAPVPPRLLQRLVWVRPVVPEANLVLLTGAVRLQLGVARAWMGREGLVRGADLGRCHLHARGLDDDAVGPVVQVHPLDQLGHLRDRGRSGELAPGRYGEVGVARAPCTVSRRLGGRSPRHRATRHRAAVRKEARPEHGVAPLPDVGDAADVSEGVVAAVEMVREEDVGDLLVEVVLELRLAHGLRDGLEDVDEGDVHGGLHGGRVDEIEQSIQAAHRRVLALGHGRVRAREQLALAILIGQSLAGVAGGVAGGVRARPVHACLHRCRHGLGGAAGSKRANAKPAQCVWRWVLIPQRFGSKSDLDLGH
eukprot:scaffold15590_cov61-Phaeocystis_antarctica.AAC.2